MESNVRSPVITKSDNEESCEAASAKNENENDEKIVQDNDESDVKSNGILKTDDEQITT